MTEISFQHTARMQRRHRAYDGQHVCWSCKILIMSTYLWGVWLYIPTCLNALTWFGSIDAKSRFGLTDASEKTRLKVPRGDFREPPVRFDGDQNVPLFDSYTAFDSMRIEWGRGRFDIESNAKKFDSIFLAGISSKKPVLRKRVLPERIPILTDRLAENRSAHNIIFVSKMMFFGSQQVEMRAKLICEPLAVMAEGCGKRSLAIRELFYCLGDHVETVLLDQPCNSRL
ncbi:hypothetical protein HRG_012277 [Hirsutella rhossiliensis]